MPLAAENPTDRVQQLIILTERLNDLIAHETQLLREHRPIEISAFQDERAKLSNIYVQEMQRISADKNLIDGVTSDLKMTLKNRTIAFRESLNDHGTALYGVRHASEGMVKAVAEEIARQANDSAPYGKDADTNTKSPDAHTAFTLDETI